MFKLDNPSDALPFQCGEKDVFIKFLKIEKWIANAIRHCLEESQLPEDIYGINSVPQSDDLYEIDLSTKNPLHNKSRIQQYELTI